MVATKADYRKAKVSKNGQTFITNYDPDNVDGAVRDLTKMAAIGEITWWAVAALGAEMRKQQKPKRLQREQAKVNHTESQSTGRH